MSAKLCLIKWNDSATMRGWFDKRDMPKEATPLECVTVGWLVRENDEEIVLAASKNEDQWGGLWIVPRSCVYQQLELKVAEVKTEDAKEEYEIKKAVIREMEWRD